MITGISFVSVPVDDIDEALRFYCDLLGMEKRIDAATEDGYRFVEVAPPGSPTGLAPYTHHDQPPRATIGESSRVVLRVEDVQRAYDELKVRGVRFDSEPFDSDGRSFVLMRDPWNNAFVLTGTDQFSA